MKKPQYLVLNDGEDIIRAIEDETGFIGKAMGAPTGSTVASMGGGLHYGTFFITSTRLIFESVDGRRVHEYLHDDVNRTKGKNSGMGDYGNIEIFPKIDLGSTPSWYVLRCGKDISDYLNQEFYTQKIKNERLINKSKEYEYNLNYDRAIEIYEELGKPAEAARVRKLKSNLAAPKTEIHGDYVDDRDTIVKDSVLNRSNIGNSDDDKIAKLEKIADMKDKGIIDDDEFKQMKKEILGK